MVGRKEKYSNAANTASLGFTTPASSVRSLMNVIGKSINSADATAALGALGVVLDPKISGRDMPTWDLDEEEDDFATWPGDGDLTINVSWVDPDEDTGPLPPGTIEYVSVGVAIDLER